MGSNLNKLRGLLYWLVVGSPSAAGTGGSLHAIDGGREAADEGGPAGNRRLLGISFLAAVAFSILSVLILDRPLAYACSGLGKGSREFLRLSPHSACQGGYIVKHKELLMPEFEAIHMQRRNLKLTFHSIYA